MPVFDIACGSALECATALDVLAAKAALDDNNILSGKNILISIISMLVGLVKSNSTDRIYEESMTNCNEED